MGRRLRSRLDLLHSSLQETVLSKQRRMKRVHDEHVRRQTSAPGDEVYTKNFVAGPKWVPAIIEANTGPVSCKVRLGSGAIHRRNYDQVRARTAQSEVQAQSWTDFQCCQAMGRFRQPSLFYHQWSEYHRIRLSWGRKAAVIPLGVLGFNRSLSLCVRMLKHQ